MNCLGEFVLAEFYRKTNLFIGTELCFLCKNGLNGCLKGFLILNLSHCNHRSE